MTAGEIGTRSAQTREPVAGNVAVEGGGTAPHPLGGGMGLQARFHGGVHTRAGGDPS